jgi:Zn-dependent peptidase ImmA (M78 family)
LRRIVPARARSRADIEGYALNLLREHQPEVIKGDSAFEIERFFDCELERLSGVDPDYQNLEFGIYGYTDSESKTCVISAELAIDPWQVRFLRSTIAHETYHALVHVSEFRRKKAILTSIHGKDHSLRMYRESEVKPYMNPEWQAWRFAGAILMPEPGFKKLIAEGLSVTEISNIYEVNPSFVRNRMRMLKIANKKEKGYCPVPLSLSC